MTRTIMLIGILAVALSGAAVVGQTVLPTMDGDIRQGEYRYHYYNNDIGMRLAWSIDGDTIFIAMSAPGTGWVGLKTQRVPYKMGQNGTRRDQTVRL